MIQITPVQKMKAVFNTHGNKYDIVYWNVRKAREKEGKSNEKITDI